METTWSRKVSSVPAIAVPAEDTLGPAMQALSINQRAFVIAMLTTGAQDGTVCAAMAGYGNTQESRWVASHRLMHNPKVLAAIKEEADRRLRSGAILAASALVEICADTRHKDRFKAAQELLNRAGLLVETQHRVIVEDHRTDKEIEQAIVLMAKRHGLDPAKLLGYTTKPIDAEFTEVEDDAPMSSDGIEDLL